MLTRLKAMLRSSTTAELPSVHLIVLADGSPYCVCRNKKAVKAVVHALGLPLRVCEYAVLDERQAEEVGRCHLPSITCPHCGLTSYNENDVRQRYCGRCHRFLDVL